MFEIGFAVPQRNNKYKCLMSQKVTAICFHFLRAHFSVLLDYPNEVACSEVEVTKVRLVLK